MKLYSLLAMCSLSVIVASNAQAADPYMPQYSSTSFAPSFSWSGAYIGGQLGGSWSDDTINATGRSLPTETFVQSYSLDTDNFIGGLYAGYNFQFDNNIVLGAETDWAWGKLKDEKTTDVASYRVDAQTKQKWIGATRARVGYALDRWLPYVALGVAYSKIDSHVITSQASGNVERLSAAASDTFTGWTLGAGFDYAMGDNLILRAEYRHNDLGNKNYGKDDINYKVDHATNDIRVGVALKF